MDTKVTRQRSTTQFIATRIHRQHTHRRVLGSAAARAMGSSLPKPVCSTVLERHGSEHFRVGLAEMNGWRVGMEDAHVVHVGDADGGGYFGILDGRARGARRGRVTPRASTHTLALSVRARTASYTPRLCREGRSSRARPRPPSDSPLRVDLPLCTHIQMAGRSVHAGAPNDCTSCLLRRAAQRTTRPPRP